MYLKTEEQVGGFFEDDEEKTAGEREERVGGQVARALLGEVGR